MTRNELVAEMIERKEVEYNVAKKATMERLEGIIQRLEAYKNAVEKGGLNEINAVVAQDLQNIINGREAQLLLATESEMNHAMRERADLSKIVIE